MRKFGVEIEGYSTMSMSLFAKTVSEASGVPLIVKGWQRDSLTPETFILTTDGSVKADELQGNKGWEIVSPPLTSETVENLKKILTSIRDTKLLKKMVFKTNKTCSVHVHIDRSDLSREDLFKVFNLYGLIEDKLNLMFPPSRRNNTERNGQSYCGPIRNINFEDAIEKVNHELKYYSVHFPKNVPTIEFRIHGATTNFMKIMSWVQIINEIINYSVNNPLVTEAPHLDKILTPDSYKYYRARVKSLASSKD